MQPCNFLAILLSLTMCAQALPFRLFGATTSNTEINPELHVVRDTFPSISVLNYRIPERKIHGLFDRPSPAISPEMQVG
jgi:hypothetical protein